MNSTHNHDHDTSEYEKHVTWDDHFENGIPYSIGLCIIVILTFFLIVGAKGILTLIGMFVGVLAICALAVGITLGLGWIVHKIKQMLE